MADQKITALTADASPTGDDLVVTVQDPGGTPSNRKVTLQNLATALISLGFPLLAPDGTTGAPSYSFTNGADCGIYLVNGTPDHLLISVGNKDFLDFYQSSSAPVLLMSLNNNTKIGFGNGSISRGGFMAGTAPGAVRVISDESATPGCVYSATADLFDSFGNKVPWHSKGQVFRHVLTGNRTIGPPKGDGGSNSISGIIITIMLVQDGTGSRTVTWDSGYKWAGGSAPTLTTAANAVDIFRFWCDGSNQAFEISRSIDVK